MRTWLIALALFGCADLDIKRERPLMSTKTVPRESEPDLETAATRVVSGEDVIVSKDGTWLVARRCIWTRRDLHACEVVFVEGDRVTGYVPVFDAHAAGSLKKQAAQAVHAVKTTIAKTIGAQRVALSSKLRYGWRDAQSSSLSTRVVEANVELFNWQFRTEPALTRATWYFGDAVEAARFQSPRSPELLVFELRLRPDAASCHAVFRSDASGHFQLITIAPPMTPPVGLPRFPTADEVMALHNAVGRELAQMRPGVTADDLRRRFGYLPVTEFLDTPEKRLDITLTLEGLRAKIRSSP